MMPSRTKRDTSFATFMDRAGPALLRTAWFLTGDADRAQELTQAAFVKTYLVWPKIDHDRALPYARRCLVNHQIDVSRATRHEVADLTGATLEAGSASVGSAPVGSAPVGSAPVGPAPVGSASQSHAAAEATADHRDDLVRRLSRLPEQQRKVVVLRYYADQSEVSVADALGISIGTATGVASSGLAALRQPAQAQTQLQVQTPNATIDLEGALRREFNGATPPSSLTFHPESVVLQGKQTIRRRRRLIGGSAALAVTLVAAGVGLLNYPQDSAAPQPTTPTATPTATSSIIRTDVGFTPSGTFQVELNRDAKVTHNVKLFFIKEGGGRREVVTWSTTKPGQKPDATWKSGMVDGYPFTIGLVPGTTRADIKLADGASHNIDFVELKGTGYTAFALRYPDPNDPVVNYADSKAKEAAARPAKITSISWSGPAGIVDGIEDDHRLIGQILAVDKSVSVKVMLRPAAGGRTTVFGQVRLNRGPSFFLNVATTDASGVAVVTGRYPIERPTSKGLSTDDDGAPIAAGILPPGATDIGVILTTGEIANGLPVSERLPDGRVIFAIQAEGAQPSNLSKDSIKAVTWTNADGSQGRKDVTQREG